MSLFQSRSRTNHLRAKLRVFWIGHSDPNFSTCICFNLIFAIADTDWLAASMRNPGLRTSTLIDEIKLTFS